MRKDYTQLIGTTTNGLTLMSIEGISRKSTWGIFRCECGAEKSIRIHAVADGNTRSCGCKKRIATIATFTTHGGVGTPEYEAWSGMKARCYNKNNKAYYRYGGRGIVVCDRWKEFQNFLDDMGPRPSTDHSVDRKKNDGPYSPDNCRWATKSEQASNRRSTRYVTYKGRTQCHNDWAKELGVSRYMITSRVDRGLSDEEVIEAYL